MSSLHRFLWIGYVANVLLGFATPMARAAFGRNAELWPVAASILLTLMWAYLLHKRGALWHRALAMGIAGLVSGAGTGMIVLYSLTLSPRLLASTFLFVVVGVLLTRLFINEMRTEAASQKEVEQWEERFEKMSEQERLEELQKLSREIEERIAKVDNRSRFVWPVFVGGVILLGLGVWIRFLMPR